MKLLLLSNSTNFGHSYLTHAVNWLNGFASEFNIKKVLFIPNASVLSTYDEHLENVRTALSKLNIEIKSIHQFDSPTEAVEKASCIMVGGGNTFKLLNFLHKAKILELIRNKVIAGMPYIGWSAGANITCPTIQTTNDMQIIVPSNSNSLNLVPFQINPHFTNSQIPLHSGESRSDRLKEFVSINKKMKVLALIEGMGIKVTPSEKLLLGGNNAKVFYYDSGIKVSDVESIDFLFNS